MKHSFPCINCGERTVLGYPGIQTRTLSMLERKRLIEEEGIRCRSCWLSFCAKRRNKKRRENGGYKLE